MYKFDPIAIIGQPEKFLEVVKEVFGK